MTARKAPAPTKPAMGPSRYEYACFHVEQCGFVGAPDETRTPYAACVVGGVCDPTRHIRTPVGAR